MNPKEQQFKNLIDFKEVLDKLNIPFLLFGGTLLGVYRAGDFIPGDEKDLDILIDKKYRPRINEITQGLLEKGFGKPNHFSAFGKWEAATYKRGGVNLDLAVYHQRGDDIYKILFNRISRNQKYMFLIHPGTSHCFEKFNKIKFKGVEFQIPQDTEFFLEVKYGKDWRKPIPQSQWLKRWLKSENLRLKY